MGYPDTQFFPEPFAVFQYYRHIENLIPQSTQPLAVLVVDFGGGTMDSCVIETTSEGNLSRGGTTSLPLGIQSCVGAGKEIDRRLLKCAIQKVSDLQIRQEPVEARINSRPWVLLAVEQMKIDLTAKMQGARLEEDCKHVSETFVLPIGSYHPDKSVQLELTGEDLKRVVTDLWRDKRGPGAAIVATISEAKHRKGSVYLQQLDKIIVAGGSSRLPFLRELLIKSISGQIPFKPEDVLLGSTSEQAVALGIAVEAAQDRTKSQRTHHAIGPCVFSELYFVTAPRRREQAVLPKIHVGGKRQIVDLPAGTLLAGPMQVDEFTIEYRIDLPFRPHASLLYWFCDKPDVDSPEANRLNVSQDILHLPPKEGLRRGLIC
jgi:molecular chaperone DnaK (HSP70)